MVERRFEIDLRVEGDTVTVRFQVPGADEQRVRGAARAFLFEMLDRLDDGEPITESLEPEPFGLNITGMPPAEVLEACTQERDRQFLRHKNDPLCVHCNYPEACHLLDRRCWFDVQTTFSTEMLS